jgi:hypothetical protein
VWLVIGDIFIREQNLTGARMKRNAHHINKDSLTRTVGTNPFKTFLSSSVSLLQGRYPFFKRKVTAAKINPICIHGIPLDQI